MQMSQNGALRQPLWPVRELRAVKLYCIYRHMYFCTSHVVKSSHVRSCDFRFVVSWLVRTCVRRDTLSDRAHTEGLRRPPPLCFSARRHASPIRDTMDGKTRLSLKHNREGRSGHESSVRGLEPLRTTAGMRRRIEGHSSHRGVHTTLCLASLHQEPLWAPAAATQYLPLPAGPSGPVAR